MQSKIAPRPFFPLLKPTSEELVEWWTRDNDKPALEEPSWAFGRMQTYRALIQAAGARANHLAFSELPIFAQEQIAEDVSKVSESDKGSRIKNVLRDEKLIPSKYILHDFSYISLDKHTFFSSKYHVIHAKCPTCNIF